MNSAVTQVKDLRTARKRNARFYLIQSAAIHLHTAAMNGSDKDVSVRNVAAQIKLSFGKSFRWSEIAAILTENDYFLPKRKTGNTPATPRQHPHEGTGNTLVPSRARSLARIENGEGCRPGPTTTADEGDDVGEIVRGTKHKAGVKDSPERPQRSERDQKIDSLITWFASQIWGTTDRSKHARNQWGALLDDICKGDAELVRKLVHEAYEVKHTILTTEYPRFNAQAVLFYAKYKRAPEKDADAPLDPIAFRKFKELLETNNVDAVIIKRYIRMLAVRWDQVQRAFSESDYQRLFNAASDEARRADS